MKYDYANEILESIMDGTMAMQHELVMIPTEKIFPHPQNPRRDLGDLEELADSIRAQGVLQNLTVVPWQRVFENDDPPCEGAVVTVIGHRRCAAAKQAHLWELPCIIVDMDKQEQVATMLLENMQRTDLSILEQAQGMQMMMDLGSTVEEISELTGFAPRTVQRRLQIAKLPEDVFDSEKAAMLTIEDYVELSRIKDKKAQKSVMRTAGTNNFRWNLENALRQQEENEAFEKILPWLEAAGIKKYDGNGNPLYGANWDQVYNVKPTDILKSGSLPKTPNRNLKGAVWYRTSYSDYLSVLVPAKKRSASMPKKTEKETEADEARAKLEALWKKAWERRYKFIMEFRADKKYMDTIMVYILRGATLSVSGARVSERYESLWEALGKKAPDKWTRPKFEDLWSMVKQDKGVALLAWVLTGDNEKLRPYDPGYGDHMPEYQNDSYGCKIISRAYGLLESLGFVMSDEENKLYNGMHELYGGKNG